MAHRHSQAIPHPKSKAMNSDPVGHYDDSFYRLQPDVVLKSVEAAGLAPTGHCQQLNSYENRVFDLKLEDGSHVITKFYRPLRWTDAQILEEHAFLFELQENDIPVCAPLHFPDGSTLKSIEGLRFTVWPRTGGRSADELTDSQLQLIGRLLGRIHNVGASKESAARWRLNAGHFALAPLAYLEEREFLPSSLLPRYRKAVIHAVELFEDLSKGIPVHRIHGDCHIGNLLYSREQDDENFFFLDFDDFLTGPAVQDFWMLAPAVDTDGLRQRAVMIDAYRSFRDFDDSQLRLIGPLRAFRYIHYAGWIAKRWSDPAFPLNFPHFGTDEYWEKETQDLERLLREIDEPAAGEKADGIETADKSEELTNADFFWDWEG